ncbi:MAG: hypothetical protein ACYC2T_06985 [Bacillota bacterium]
MVKEKSLNRAENLACTLLFLEMIFYFLEQGRKLQCFFIAVILIFNLALKRGLFIPEQGYFIHQGFHAPFSEGSYQQCPCSVVGRIPVLLLATLKSKLQARRFLRRHPSFIESFQHIEVLLN